MHWFTAWTLLDTGGTIVNKTEEVAAPVKNIESCAGKWLKGCVI